MRAFPFAFPSPLRLPVFGRILALLSLSASAVLAARSVDEYVHGSAAKYIQGRLQEAGVEVEEGLRLYPTDPRLKAMAGQLKQMKDQQKKDQGGESRQGGDQNQDKKDKPDSSAQGKNGENQDRKDQDKDQAKEKENPEAGNDKDKDKGKTPEQESQEQQPQPQDGKQGDSTGQAAEPAKPGQMSKEEAERLLNSYQDDEKREQKQMQRRNRRPVEVEEDW